MWLPLTQTCQEKGHAALLLLGGDRSPDFPLISLNDTWGREHFVELCGKVCGELLMWSMLTLQGGSPHYQLVEMKVLALGLPSLTPLWPGELGSLATAWLGWKSSLPTWPLFVWVWVEFQVSCGVRLKQSGYYLKGFYLARLPLSWSFGYRE